MIKLLIYIVVVLILGAGFAWLADRPGDLLITWQGREIEMSLVVGAAFVVALVVAILIVVGIVRAIVASPRTARRYFRGRKRDRGYQALSAGLLAAGAGDAAKARAMNKRTQGLLSADREPLIHLLEAQTALIEGDHAAARAKFESMVDNPETRDLALRGLYLEARRLNADEAARHYAEQAAGTAPHLPWAAQAALEFRSREGKWDDALRLLEKQRMARVVDKADADRKKAVLLTARAIDRLDGNPRGAREDALEALRLAPDLVPAAVTGARALFREDNLRKGSKVLEKAWKREPHPEIAETYVRARIGDSVLDRLRRAEKLEALKPNHIESLLVVSRAALDAGDHARARAKAEAAARQQPREGVYLLLADIEEAETGDQGRVRHWLGQALRAGRDPTWTADGYVAERWAAVSPVTGRLDAFVWRVPVEQLAGPVVEASGESEADRAIRSLPPVRETKPAEPEESEDVPFTPVAAPAEQAGAPAEPAAAEPAPTAWTAGVAEAAGAKPAEARPEPPVSESGALAEDLPRADVTPREAAGTPKDLASSKPAERDPVNPAPATFNGDARPAESRSEPARRPDETPRHDFFERRPDDPGVDEEEETDRAEKPRFRLF
ncbi:MAG: heme biosynthesis HemY N-terminal domain-containing protein [Pararhizobium sp.]